MAKLEGRDLIQLNATVIAGLLILFTITSIQGAGEKIIYPDGQTQRILDPISLTIRYIVMIFSISSILPLAYSILLLLIFYETLLKKEMEIDLSKMLEAETDLGKIKFDVKKEINKGDKKPFEKKESEIFSKALKWSRIGYRYLMFATIAALISTSILYIVNIMIIF
jgi:hypothetical protein